MTPLQSRQLPFDVPVNPCFVEVLITILGYSQRGAVHQERDVLGNRPIVDESFPCGARSALELEEAH